MTTAYIREFKAEYAFLSNFYPASFTWYGLVWPTAEHAYQAAKSLRYQDWLHIQALPTPGKAKHAGRTLILRLDWEEIKVYIMTAICKAKFSQNPALMAALLATGDAVLEEGNSWGDRTWGICPATSGIGHNHLGRILMQIRSENAL